jgi:hypothetical protein
LFAFVSNRSGALSWLRYRSSNKPKKKKGSPSHPTLPEGDEETVMDGNDDESDSFSVTPSELASGRDEANGRQSLLSSLQPSTDDEEDPEVIAARERLLANDLLRNANLAAVSDLSSLRESSVVERLASGLMLSPDAGSSFDEILRPSIFTTVATLAEMERRRTRGDAPSTSETSPLAPSQQTLSDASPT